MNGLKALKELHGKALKTYPVDQCRIWNLSFADEEFLSFAKVALPEILRAAEAGEKLAETVRVINVSDEFSGKEPGDKMDVMMKAAENIMAESNKLWRKRRDAALAAYDAMVKGE